MLYRIAKSCGQQLIASAGLPHVSPVLRKPKATDFFLRNHLAQTWIGGNMGKPTPHTHQLGFRAGDPPSTTANRKKSWLFLFADLPTVEDFGDLCADTLLPLCRHFACHFLQLWVPLASTWTFNQFGSSLFFQCGDVSKPIFQPSWGVLTHQSQRAWDERHRSCPATGTAWKPSAKVKPKRCPAEW